MGILHPLAAGIIARDASEGVQQRTPAWYEARRTKLTASDVAAALDTPPYASFRGSARKEALKRKLDNVPLRGPALQHGVDHEDEARDLAARALGEEIFEVGLLGHPSVGWLAASPDGVASSGRLVEIKCPLKREIIPGHVPEHYMPQLQAQMEVCGAQETLFVQYKPASLTGTGRHILDIVVVARDPMWLHGDPEPVRRAGPSNSGAAPALRRFWEEYMAALPDHTPPSPPRCSVRRDMYADFSPKISRVECDL